MSLCIALRIKFICAPIHVFLLSLRFYVSVLFDHSTETRLVKIESCASEWNICLSKKSCFVFYHLNRLHPPPLPPPPHTHTFCVVFVLVLLLFFVFFGFVCLIVYSFTCFIIIKLIMSSLKGAVRDMFTISSLHRELFPTRAL